MVRYMYIYTSEAPMHGRVLSRRVQYRLTLLHGLVISAAPGGWQPPIGGWRRGARRRRREYPLRVCTIVDIADSVGQSHDKNQSLAASSCSRCSPSRSSFIRPAARSYFCFPPVTRSLFSHPLSFSSVAIGPHSLFARTKTTYLPSAFPLYVRL